MLPRTVPAPASRPSHGHHRNRGCRCARERLCERITTPKQITRVMHAFRRPKSKPDLAFGGWSAAL